jgi:hypothetical protein
MAYRDRSRLSDWADKQHCRLGAISEGIGWRIIEIADRIQQNLNVIQRALGGRPEHDVLTLLKRGALGRKR